MSEMPQRPRWNELFETAARQEGLFTTQQAAAAGYSPQLVVHHVRAGRFVRVERGIYRLVHFPVGDREDLVAIWLWSERAGVFSHETALLLHDLSDVLPVRAHVTLPLAWRRRRLRVPAGVLVHHGDVPSEDRTWFGAVPTTNARRTLVDCARSHLSPELLEQATVQALQRGLVRRSELGEVDAALAPFGGIPT
jgi:predicted transcriptional regulator of viral defense system